MVCGESRKLLHSERGEGKNRKPIGDTVMDCEGLGRGEDIEENGQTLKTKEGKLHDIQKKLIVIDIGFAPGGLLG